MADFKVYIGTPVASYQWDKIHFEQQRKASMKRAAKGSQPEEVKEPTYEYNSMIVVQAKPEYKVPFWANMARTHREPVILHPKVSFDHMRLLCGEREIEPIRPMRFQIRVPENAGYRFDQDSMMGEYFYAPDSLPPSCGSVTLELYSTAQATTPVKRLIENPLRDRLWMDFEPFRRVRARANPEAPQSDAK